MASLITAAQKTTLNDVMDDQHDTFARAVTVFKDAIETISSPSSSFNSIYGNAGATTPITYTPSQATVKARIQYGADFSEDYFASSRSPNQIKVYIPEGLVRMKIKSSDLSTLREAKRIEFDSQTFSVYGDFRGHGLFDSQFYTVMLKKTP